MCTVSICYSNCYISLKVLCQARNRNSYFKAHRCTVPIILCYILLPFVAPYSFFCKNEQYCDWVFSLVVIPRITIIILPSVLWRCWLGGRKGIRPVKTEWWGTGVVICLEQGADWCHCHSLVSCFSKIQIGSTFPVPAHMGSPGKRAVKQVCVCVCVLFWE